MIYKKYIVVCFFTVLSTIHIDAQQQPQRRKQQATLAQKRAAAQRLAQQKAAQQRIPQRPPQRIPQRPLQLPSRVPQRGVPQRAPQPRVAPPLPPRVPQRSPHPPIVPQRPPQPTAQQKAAEEERRLFIEQQQIPWTSRAGLIYGPDRVHGSRVNHILHHTRPAPHKPVHAMFLAKTRKELFDLIDSAWLTLTNPCSNPTGEFNINMGKVIGTRGERRLKMIIIPGTSQIITAYPIR